MTETTPNWQQFEVQYLDLTSTLSYMLTQEIPRREVIENVHLKTLKDWVHVLRQYLPLSAPVRRLFYKLDEYIRPLHLLRADDWLAHVQSYQVSKLSKCSPLPDFRMNSDIHFRNQLHIYRVEDLNHI